MSPRPKTDDDLRREPRRDRQIPCELWIRGRGYSGMIENISRTGLFIETLATAVPGSAVTLVIAPGEGRTEIRITGRVMRREEIEAQSRMVPPIGFGLGVEVIDPGALGRLMGDLQLVIGEPEPRDS